MHPDGFKSGYIALCGRPNTGKTTLINKLCGQKIGIVSSKPQTTRTRIMGVVTNEKAQLIFLDTPGLVAGELGSPFDQRVRDQTLETLNDADVIVMVIDCLREWGNEDQLVVERAMQTDQPKIILFNKIDVENAKQCLQSKQNMLAKMCSDIPTLNISATLEDGIEKIIPLITELLPEGPLYYPKNTLTDQSARFIASELIREQIFLQTGKEVPYGCTVIIDEYKENKSHVNIMATIVCDREALKPILIGRKGQKIKAIGIAARQALEDFTGKKIRVELFVKVDPNWRKSKETVKRYGY